MKKIIVHSGKTIENKCSVQLHPITEVENANKAILNLNDDKELIFYSNSPDFVSSIRYIALKYGIDAEFFLNGISHGSNIEPLFEDFNIAIDLMCEFADIKE